LALDTDRQLFRDELRKRSIEEKNKARSVQEQLFWMDVAQYVLASFVPKDRDSLNKAGGLAPTGNILKNK
jgi:hypothetical protein